MSPIDTGFPRDPEPKKRMLPSVTDVVRELTKSVSADPAVLFKAARSVVAEELAKVKQGFEAAPQDVLVRRARLQLEREGAAVPVSEPAPPPMPVFPARPAPADDPFQDLASHSDLNWENDLPIQPEDAPFRSAILPIPRKSRGPLEISAPVEPLPQPVVASAPSVPLVHPPEPEPSEAPADPLPAPVAEMPPVREPLEDNAQPAMEEFHFKAADPLPPPPSRSGGRGWLVAITLVLAVGAGLAWAVREYVFKNEIVKSVAPVARKKPEEAPVAIPAPLPIPTSAPAVAAKPAAPVAKASAPVPKGRAALLMTPDWVGKPAVYVIHFSSTKDRESAAKEARKLGAAVGAPARAVEVDLGDKGVWYRVVVGEFPDVDAARAFRAGLEAKKTPGMGFVYEMRGR
jgi:SPOR domain